MWVVIWFAFVIYVVKAPLLFVVFAAALLAYGAFKALRAWRVMPKLTAEKLGSRSFVAPNKPPLEISIARKANEYSRFLILVPIVFFFMGAMTFPWLRLGEHIDFKNWQSLVDYGLGAAFMCVGTMVGYQMMGGQFRMRKVLANPVCVWGVVTSTTDSGLSYRFRDLLGGEFEGSGTEYSGDYYEEMEVPVVYERDNPQNNLPVSALYEEYEVKFKIV